MSALKRFLESLAEQAGVDSLPLAENICFITADGPIQNVEKFLFKR